MKETKSQIWIKNNRIIWLFILFFSGFLIGIFEHGFGLGLLYGLILVAVDLSFQEENK